MSRLKDLCNKTVYPDLKKELKLKNMAEVPCLEKIVVNIGIGTYVARVNKDYSLVEETLIAITGQKPVLRRAKIAVSNFNKLREGEPNGLVVTLRGEKMYDFLDKLINVTLPRIRDFRGVSPKSFDGSGNYNLGIKDHTVFSEVNVDDAVKPHGMQITIVTKGNSDENAKQLLDKLKFPFFKKKISN